MPTNFFVEERKKIKQQLLEFIKQKPETPIRKVIGIFSLRTGLKASTLEVYIEELKQAEVIE